MEIDFDELKKQHRESIIESGEYAECDILIQKGSMEPMMNIKAVKVTSLDMAKMLHCFDEIKKAIAAKDPVALEIYESDILETNTQVIDLTKDNRDKTE